MEFNPQHFWVPSLCNLWLQMFLFLFIQTLHNDCSHIEDVHLFFCTFPEYFLIFFSILNGALNTSRINIALNTKLDIESQVGY